MFGKVRPNRDLNTELSEHRVRSRKPNIALSEHLQKKMNTELRTLFAPSLSPICPKTQQNVGAKSSLGFGIQSCEFGFGFEILSLDSESSEFGFSEFGEFRGRNFLGSIHH